MKELNNKIERLKRNIKDEKELLYKLIYNFNPRFFNYSYFNNLDYILNYINNFNNEYLDKFFKYNDFKQRTKIFLDYFIKEEEKEKNKSITENYIFLYNKKEVKVAKYDNKSKKLEDLKNTIIPYENEIKYVSVYDNKNQTYTIYISSSYINEVDIFNFNINSGVLIKCKSKIYKFNGQF